MANTGDNAKTAHFDECDHLLNLIVATLDIACRSEATNLETKQPLQSCVMFTNPLPVVLSSLCNGPDQ